MKQVYILIVVLFCATSCNAQMFTKVVKTAAKCINEHKLLIGVNGFKDYSYHEQQRKRIHLDVARQAVPSSKTLNPSARVKVRSADSTQSSSALISLHAQELTKQLKELQNISTLVSVRKAVTMDSISVVNEDNQ